MENNVSDIRNEVKRLQIKSANYVFLIVLKPRKYASMYVDEGKQDWGFGPG